MAPIAAPIVHREYLRIRHGIRRMSLKRPKRLKRLRRLTRLKGLRRLRRLKRLRRLRMLINQRVNHGFALACHQ